MAGRNLRHATLRHATSPDGSFALFRNEGLEALAGLRPKLTADAATLPGSRVLSGRFMAVQQAVGVPCNRPGAEMAAAMAQRAECVMLNKGPDLAEAVAAMADVLRRTDRHLAKETARLSALGAWPAERLAS